MNKTNEKNEPEATVCHLGVINMRRKEALISWRSVAVLDVHRLSIVKSGLPLSESERERETEILEEENDWVQLVLRGF